MALPDPYIPDASAMRNFNDLDQRLATKIAWGDGSVASAATITLPDTATAVTVTGTTGITSVTIAPAGRVVVLLFTATLTVTDGSNLKLAGNFSATADDTLMLLSDGTNWYEVSRSNN